MVQRGRVLFIILSVLIVLNEASNLTLEIANGIQYSHWLRSIFLPLIIIWSVWSLWTTGEKWTRIALGTMVVIKGLTGLAVFGLLMFHMAKITPTTQARDFLEIAAYLLALPVGHALLFVVMGLLILSSPSIRAFLETRAPWSTQKELLG